MNFWKQLACAYSPRRSHTPFFVLAPMAEVTDVAFREFIAVHGSNPDVYYTEFVSCKGLLSDKGRQALIRDLYYTENQRPIVAQVFGNDPKDFYETARLIAKLGFDGIDINMGCPDKKIEKSGAGAALIKDLKRAQEIVVATREGAGTMPVSVKTRIGYNVIETEKWIGALLNAKPDALLIHGRTRKEMSKVPAHWGEIAVAAKMCRESGVVCVGNGDVKSREEGERRAKESGVDGIMIGRGVFGSPFVFTKQTTQTNTDRTQTNTDEDPRRLTRKNKLNSLGNLIVLFDAAWKNKKSFHILKKHFSSYVRGWSGAKELRSRMMETESSAEALDTLEQYCADSGIEWSVDREQEVKVNERFGIL